MAESARKKAGRAAASDRDRPLVALCAGKDCRKRTEFAKMRAALDAECEMAELKCVGICSGPVVVVRPESASPIVLSKLRTKRQRKHVLRVVADDRGVPPELADRVVRSASTVRKVKRALRDIA